MNENNFILKPVTENEVTVIIAGLDESKAGSSSISTKFLKKFHNIFIPIITILINKSFFDGVFPDSLKIADVVPVFKKNDRLKCCNYRPISLLSNISKIFERAFHTRLYEFVEGNNLLYTYQFGFRRKHSTEHSLISIIENIKTKLDKQQFGCGIFIDLEKAFDTVNHKILISKLRHYGVRGNASNWITDYLTNRKQRVKISDTYSDCATITCGVPQGSILGPLLFIIYINDMHKSMKHSKVYHFADDTNLFHSHSNLKSLRKQANEDLALLFDWLCANKLSLNADKTEFILFHGRRAKKDRITLTINNTKIFESKKMKYLGLIVDSKLNWNFHVSELKKKLNRAIAILYKVKKRGFDQTTMCTMYFALFHSYLNYGLNVWGLADKKILKRIRVIQNNAIRAIIGIKKHESCSKFYKDLEILKLNDMIFMNKIKFIWDFESKTIPTCFLNSFQHAKSLHRHKTRYAHKNKLSKTRKYKTTKHGLNCFINLSITASNQLNDLQWYKSIKTRFPLVKELKEFVLASY